MMYDFLFNLIGSTKKVVDTLQDKQSYSKGALKKIEWKKC